MVRARREEAGGGRGAARGRGQRAPGYIQPNREFQAARGRGVSRGARRQAMGKDSQGNPVVHQEAEVIRGAQGEERWRCVYCNKDYSAKQNGITYRMKVLYAIQQD